MDWMWVDEEQQRRQDKENEKKVNGVTAELLTLSYEDPPESSTKTRVSEQAPVLVEDEEAAYEMKGSGIPIIGSQNPSTQEELIMEVVAAENFNAIADPFNEASLQVEADAELARTVQRTLDREPLYSVQRAEPVRSQHPRPVEEELTQLERIFRPRRSVAAASKSWVTTTEALCWKCGIGRALFEYHMLCDRCRLRKPVPPGPVKRPIKGQPRTNDQRLRFCRYCGAKCVGATYSWACEKCQPAGPERKQAKQDNESTKPDRPLLKPEQPVPGVDEFVVTRSTCSCLGEVITMGKNLDGQLGRGTTLPCEEPVHVEFVGSICTQVAAGKNQTACLLQGGTVFVWGSTSPGPREISGLDPWNVQCIALHRRVLYAVTDNGRLLESAIGVYLDTNICTVQDFLMVTSSDFHCAAVTATGALYTWGNGESGQLGHKSCTSFPKPRKVIGLENIPIMTVAVGQNTTVAVSRNGRVYSSGCNDHGQLGFDAKLRQLKEFKLVASLSHVRIADVSLGSSHVVARGVDGRLHSWGSNSEGQLGLGDRLDRYSPCPVPLDVECVRVACGGAMSTAVTANGYLYACGDNSHGQFGEGASHTVFCVVTCLQHRALQAVACGEKHIACVAATADITPLSIDLSTRFTTPSYSDVTIRCSDEQTFESHRFILARSKYLLDLLQHTDHSVQRRIEISIPLPSAVFKPLLRLLYCNASPAPQIDWELTQELSRYNINDFLPTLSLDEYLFRLLNQAEDESIHSGFIDCRFRLSDGSLLPAHKALLSARSPLFQLMFDSGMKESDFEAVLDVPEWDRSTYTIFLSYLYSGRLPEAANDADGNVWVELLTLSCQYELFSLKNICEQNLLKYINAGSVANLFSCAMIYTAGILADKCHEFISSVGTNKIADFASIKVTYKQWVTTQAVKQRSIKSADVPVKETASDLVKFFFGGHCELEEEDRREQHEMLVDQLARESEQRKAFMQTRNEEGVMQQVQTVAEFCEDEEEEAKEEEEGDQAYSQEWCESDEIQDSDEDDDEDWQEL